MTDNYTVYAHRCIATDTVFYIGIGQRRRPYEVHSRNRFWRHYVAKHGDFAVEIIAAGLTADGARAMERQLIGKHGRVKDGGSLTNITLGGDSQPMHDPEIAARVAAKLKGHGVTPEARAKMSASAKRRGPHKNTIEATRVRMLSPLNPMFRPENRQLTSKRFSHTHSPSRRIKNGAAHCKPVEQYSRDGELLQVFPSARAAAKAFDCTPALIGMACAGRCKSARGFFWKKTGDIACRRVSESLKQLDLFIARPAPLNQEALL